ncbi:DoxX family protein [Streptomyces sp. NPDC058000]|uniref:DoxX family protein n=1 Tax=Streptomyces sp. NPDC058000 TaxID=3346299 RepID=UPI0036E38106
MSKEKLAAAGASARWVEDFSAGGVKAIGALEVLAAVGLILPAVLHIDRFWCRWLPSAW